MFRVGLFTELPTRLVFSETELPALDLRSEGPAACEHHKNWPAEALKHAAREYVLELLHKPETMRQQGEEQIESEIAALRNPERKIKA